jgi:tRNA (guanine37-N1)-methyltransferase
MAIKSICLKVPKQQGQQTLVLVNKLGIVNNSLEIQRDEDFIYIPLVNKPTEDKLKTLREPVVACEISTCVFTERKKKPSIAELLEGRLPKRLLASLPHSMDFVGDIAIVGIPSELDACKSLIGKAILEANQNVRTVLAKASAVGGAYRLREFNVIAGDDKTETIHKEHGCKYYVDIAKAYFSPRLSYEHNRVASLVNEGETIVDLFAGVGPFAIPIAKSHENVKVHAIDMNPHAIEFLKRNIRLNRVEGRINAILGDARQVVNDRLLGVADRVIMNLPEKAMEFVNVGCHTLKPTGGVAHFYSFTSVSDPIENVQSRFAESVEACGRKVEKVLLSKLVRETAPYEWQAVLDARIL